MPEQPAATRRRVRYLSLIVACIAALGLTACGSGGSDAVGDQPGDGKQIFSDAGCGGCHTFAPAGSNGKSGPELNRTALGVDQVAAKVKEGGGGMPSFEDKLTEQQIQALSRFVVSSAEIN